MKSGTPSIGDVQKTCQMSDKTTYSWRKGAKQKNLAKRQKVQAPTAVYREIEVRHVLPVEQIESSCTFFKPASCESDAAIYLPRRMRKDCVTIRLKQRANMIADSDGLTTTSTATGQEAIAAVHVAIDSHLKKFAFRKTISTMT